MLAIVKAIASGLVSPIAKLGEVAINASRDKRRIDAHEREIDTGMATRHGIALIGKWFVGIPAFLIALSAAMHVAVVLIDSTFPSDLVNPLALPKFYGNILLLVVTAIFGPVAWKMLRR